jgi:RNA polymerase sigma-70 factor, ECF subfamily
MTRAMGAPAAELARRRFDELFSTHYRVVAAYARRRTSAEAADDVVAETFLVAWRRLDDVPAEAAPWLLAVARRVLANHRRGERRRLALVDRLAQPSDDAAPADDSPVLRALSRLSEADRELLVLLAWDELSLADAAEVLGCSYAAVKVRLHRARRRLRRELAVQATRAVPASTLELENCHER